MRPQHSGNPDTPEDRDRPGVRCLHSERIAGRCRRCGDYDEAADVAWRRQALAEAGVTRAEVLAIAREATETARLNAIGTRLETMWLELRTKQQKGNAAKIGRCDRPLLDEAARRKRTGLKWDAVAFEVGFESGGEALRLAVRRAGLSVSRKE